MHDREEQRGRVTERQQCAHAGNRALDHQSRDHAQAGQSDRRRIAATSKESSRKNELIRASLESATGRGVPEWLTLSAESFTGKVQSLPSREDIKLPIQEQLIVELYSR